MFKKIIFTAMCFSLMANVSYTLACHPQTSGANNSAGCPCTANDQCNSGTCDTNGRCTRAR